MYNVHTACTAKKVTGLMHLQVSCCTYLTYLLRTSVSQPGPENSASIAATPNKYVALSGMMQIVNLVS
jgi:hypothetical protein